jgi:6-phosphogluconolactonase
VSGETITALPDPEACARAAAGHIASRLARSAAARGVAHWATTGGSTPGAIYRNLASPPLRDEVPWDEVQLWWGDDRFVPADHPLSNVHVATSDLIEIGARSGESGTGQSGADVAGRRTPGAPIPAENVHPIPMTAAIGQGDGPEWAAEHYAAELIAIGPPFEAGIPVFDLVLIGVGPDGHILSVFPGSRTFDRDEPVLAVPAPTHVEPHVARVTLNPRIITAARDVLVVAHGASKAAILETVLHGEPDVRQWPAQLAVRDGATWIVDEAAASLLNLWPPRRR